MKILIENISDSIEIGNESAYPLPIRYFDDPETIKLKAKSWGKNVEWNNFLSFIITHHYFINYLFIHFIFYSKNGRPNFKPDWLLASNLDCLNFIKGLRALLPFFSMLG